MLFCFAAWLRRARAKAIRNNIEVDEPDENGDYIVSYLSIDGTYWHEWQYDVTLEATYAEEAAPENPFTDVPDGQYYTDPVLWAVSKNITQGTSATTFSPDNPCTRAQIVTFLYRDMK
ncbi:MAG: S-layer homology domain-containing protein [Oscillospiraceae bacterium]|nr:S-layer homology domain-containing protein [Oscillospiraceae bacterium]